VSFLHQTEGYRKRVRAQVAEALSKWWLPVPAALRSDYLQYQYQQNANFLVLINVYAHAAYFSYAMADYFIVPDIFDLSLSVRTLLLLTLLPLFIWLIRRIRNISLVELLLPLSAMIGTLVWFNMLQLSQSPYVTSYLYASLIFVVAMNIGIRANFLSGLLGSLLLSGINLYYVNLLNHADRMALLIFCLVYLPVLAFGLFISWYNTYTGRRLFLYSLIDEMNQTDLQEANRQLLVRSHTDALTGLPNRTLLEDRLRQAIIKAQRDGGYLALMIVDLDKFKPVNDTHGHAVGDELLREMARRMVACVRESDTVARMGGDEFMVLLPGVDQVHDALLVAEKIRESLNHSFALEGDRMAISASIGVAAFPEHGDDATSLFRAADEALYRAKAQGRNRVELAA
jgi:diguanylate cyclase (GGDEF)-like protein